MRAFLAILLLLLSPTLSAQTGTSLGAGSATDPFGAALSGPEFLPVEEAYQVAVDVQEDGALRIYWQIEPEYYLYQHQFKFELSDASGDIPLEVALPTALERVDEFFGEVRVYYGSADITAVPQRVPEAATLRMTSQGCADAGLCYPPRSQQFAVNFVDGSVSEEAPTNARGSAKTEPAATEFAGAGTLAYMMVLAFLGGIILNLMPCVFPVLSLKVLSFTSGNDAHASRHAWVYGAGVVVSFVAVAAILIALQQAGNAIGWGFQLQSPGFVIALAYLFIAMGLSLSGVVQFGGNLMNLGGDLAAKEGDAGSFFTGVLAVVVASPCTAPFMGTALGFALTQPAAVGLTVFAALGAGMAAPMVLLAHSALARRLMPKPGAWMETLKEALAFPLYATALWLFWVAGRQTGVDTMTVAIGGALVLTLGLWLWHRGRWQQVVSIALVALAIAMGSWRSPNPGSAGSSIEGTVAWSEQALREHRDNGQPVFVDVTADWCITCIANEQAVLFTDDMRAAFEAHGVTYMVADWTNYDADIAKFIESHGRSGIPLYLMYSGNPDQPPLLLPQILSSAVVLEALEAVSVSSELVTAN